MLRAEEVEGDPSISLGIPDGNEGRAAGLIIPPLNLDEALGKSEAEHDLVAMGI